MIRAQEVRVLEERDQIKLNRCLWALNALKKKLLVKYFPESTPDQRKEIVRGVAILYRED